MECLKMLRLSNGARKTAFATVLGMGLIGSAAVLLTPVFAQAQQWHRDMDRGDFRADRDDRVFHRDWDDRGFGRDFDDRFRVGFGVGVYGYPYAYPYYSGYYDPYAYGYDYGPYCSSYDSYYGYCSY